MINKIEKLKRYAPTIEGEQHDDPHAEMREDDFGDFVKLNDVIKAFAPEELFDEELVGFAEMFSKSYESLKDGEYFSFSKKTYKIKYFDGTIKSDFTGAAFTTFARVGHVSKEIQVSKYWLISDNKITADFVFSLVLWCAIKAKLGFQDAPDEEVDELVFKYCVKNGKSGGDIIKGWVVQADATIEENTGPLAKRIKKLLEYNDNPL